MNKFQPADRFEKARIALLRYYNSQCMTHAGYVIAVLIGLVAVISRWETFIVAIHTLIVFGITLFVLCYALFYVVHRTIFWSHLASEVLCVSEDDLLQEEKERKIPMLILHLATHRIAEGKSPTTTRIRSFFKEIHSTPKKLWKEKVFCTQCGTKNIMGANYCKKCGKKIGET